MDLQILKIIETILIIAALLRLVITVTCEIVCPIIVYCKGSSAIGWFLGGMFLGEIALIIVGCLSNKNKGIPKKQQRKRYIVKDAYLYVFYNSTLVNNYRYRLTIMFR